MHRSWLTLDLEYTGRGLGVRVVDRIKKRPPHGFAAGWPWIDRVADYSFSVTDSMTTVWTGTSEGKRPLGPVGEASMPRTTSIPEVTSPKTV